MSRNGRPKEYQNYRLIDFLEDDDFRRWILSGETEQKEEWERILMVNEEGAEAQLVLRSLKQHFDQYGLTEDEISQRLEIEIEQYRGRKNSVRGGLLSPDSA